MENLQGKRLLILGGTTWKNAIADFAKDHGIVLIAASNDPNAAFFDIAQETYVVNSTDSEQMKNLIRDKNIDGVYMGGNESVITAACDYIQESGLPCYCTRKQWDIFRNKTLFKNFCMSAGLPVLPRIQIDLNNIDENLPYPVITKPADSFGSAGFSVCNNAEELLAGYKKAVEKSSSGEVIVEKFVKNKAITAFYSFSEGKPILTGLARKYPVNYKDVGSYVSGLHILESKLKNIFRARFEDKLVKAFNSIGLREGCLWIEIFQDGDEYYFNEAGYRYAGAALPYPADYFYNVNQIGADIYFALTGKSQLYAHKSLIPDKVPRKKFYGIYPLQMKAGTISKIIGIDKFLSRDNAVFAIPTKSIGDTVKHTGTFNQVFALLHFVFDSKDELIETINDIHSKIIVEDVHGDNLVNRMLDIETSAEDFFRNDV